jgi:hypothetical protein
VSDYNTSAELRLSKPNNAIRLKNKRHTEATAVTFENAKILETVKHQLMNKFEESYIQNKHLFPDDGSRVDASGFSHE